MWILPIGHSVCLRQTVYPKGAELLALWPHSRPLHTRRGYRRVWSGRFLLAVRKPLPAGTLGAQPAIAQAFIDESLAVASQRVTLAAATSLLAFGQRPGSLRFGVGAAIKLLPGKNGPGWTHGPGR